MIEDSSDADANAREHWAIIPQQVDAALAEKAREAMWQRTVVWLNALLDYPGFPQWTLKSLGHKMVYAAMPEIDVEAIGDFTFSTEILQRQELVSGYVELISAAIDCRLTQHYFRRYPFRGLPVPREHHLRTCCELYYSRVYQFATRLEVLVTRIARRTKSTDISARDIIKQFREKLDKELEARHRIHHETAYSDFEIDSLATSDLLKDVEQGLFVMSTANYHKISKRWQTRIEQTADKLDIWVGYVAILMLARCAFLWPEVKSDPINPSLS